MESDFMIVVSQKRSPVQGFGVRHQQAAITTRLPRGIRASLRHL
jgi:hypothetical protein